MKVSTDMQMKKIFKSQIRKETTPQISKHEVKYALNLNREGINTYQIPNQELNLTVIEIFIIFKRGN